MEFGMHVCYDRTWHRDRIRTGKRKWSCVWNSDGASAVICWASNWDENWVKTEQGSWNLAWVPDRILNEYQVDAWPTKTWCECQAEAGPGSWGNGLSSRWYDSDRVWNTLWHGSGISWHDSWIKGHNVSLAYELWPLNSRNREWFMRWGFEPTTLLVWWALRTWTSLRTWTRILSFTPFCRTGSGEEIHRVHQCSHASSLELRGNLSCWQPA